MIHEYELFYRDAKVFIDLIYHQLLLTSCVQQGRIIPGAYKFNALVTTYEVILGECDVTYIISCNILYFIS